MVKRKEKIGIQVSHAPFLLFIGTSILIHGVGLLILVVSNQNLTSTKEEPKSTPIDFVIVPPEDTPEEPPPDTKRLAVNNSVAKGKNVEPELPSATNKIGNEEAIATSKSSPGNQKNIQDKSLTPTPPRARLKPLAPVLPKPQAKPEPPAPVKPPVALSKVPKPEIATPTPTPPRERVKPLAPVLPKPQAKPEPPASVKPPVALSKVPKPEIATPTPAPPRARLKPLRPLLPKPEAKPESQSLSESNSTITPSIKPIPKSPKIPSKKIEPATSQPNSSSVATNLSPKPPVINRPSSLTQPPPVPRTKPNPSSKPKTPVSSGTASLLGGTQRLNSAQNSGNNFFKPKVNASQQALNSRGLDARQNLDLGPYFAEIRRRVRRNWKPSQPNKERNTILVFSIQRNGQITGLRIVQSSGSPINDQESLEAVQKSAPFRALPANFPRQELKVQFNFNIYFN
ncbi:MAG: TonB family protein [Xenococcaceae cyanobacterium MO_167.B52]|nr:TonB family protein [Xenococcaceae cyanobacterium MO_167.B52]